MSSSTDNPPRIDSPVESIPRINLTFNNEDADNSALKIAYEFKPAWKDSEGEVGVVRFTDGITNTLSKVTKKVPGKSESENDDESLLMRAYGKGTDVLIDREREMKAHSLLATMGLAPPLLARFENGLVYKFVQGDVCTHDDLAKPEVYREVAKLLGEWHGSLPISAITDTPNLDDEASQKYCGLKDGKYTRPVPNIWSMMHRWIAALPSNTEAEVKQKEMLNGELAQLSARFGETPGLGGRDYIFSHCDLLCGNVIRQKPSGSDKNSIGQPVSFIDYEYSTPGPAAFDIANHFAEFAGYDCDHSKVPTKSQRREFLKHYVGAFRINSINIEDNLNVDIDMKQDIEQLYEQVDDFRGVPGFYWGIWALIQAMISQIDFDYPKYAEGRLSEYWAWKGEDDGSRKREGKELPLREKRWAEE